MWDGTRIMAENIADGIHIADKDVTIKILNTAKFDKNDIITEIFKAKMIVVGSPTINKGILSSVAEIMEVVKGLNFKGKKAVAFGCYGWSGESVKVLNELLKKSGFDLVNEGIRAKWNPDDESIKKCIEFGKTII